MSDTKKESSAARPLANDFKGTNIPTFGSPIYEPEEALPQAARQFLHSAPVKIAVASIAFLALVIFSFAIWQIASSVVRSTRARHALQKAYSLSDAEKFAQAIPFYTEALGGPLGTSECARAYGRRGWAYTKIDRDDDAIRDFTAALQIEPDLWFAVLDRGLAYHRQGKFKEALADYEKAIWLDRNTVDAYRNRALIFAHRGRLKEAIADMDEAVRCAPNDPRWLARRGQYYLGARELDPALASFESALRIDPENVFANSGRARVLILRGEASRAMAELHAATRTRPDSAHLSLARAIIHMDAEELDEATDDCAEAIRLQKDFAAPYALRARLEFRFGAQEAALAFATLAWQLDPKMPLPHQVRGRVLALRREYGEAILEFERARAGDPEYVSALVWRAITKAHAGYYRVAQCELIEVVEEFRGEPEAHLMFAWFLATCPEPTFRDGARAVAEAQRGLELSHGDAYALDVLATAYAESGDFARAQELELEALDKTPASSSDCRRMEARLQTFGLRIPYRDH